MMLPPAHEALVSISLIEQQVEEEVEDIDDDQDHEARNDDDEFGGGNEIGHSYWRWIYPNIEDDNRMFIEKRLLSRHSAFSKSGVSGEADEDEDGNFTFYNFKDNWIYILNNGCCQPSRFRKKFCFILLAKDFCPGHYRKLLWLFQELYGKYGFSVAKLLHQYLSLIITDQIIIDDPSEVGEGNALVFLNQNKESNELENRLNRKSSINIAGIIKLFQLDIILIYTAILLKKRIVIYHHDASQSFDFMLALPDFVPHRPLSARQRLFVPNVDLHCSEQIQDLRARQYFIATFNDSRIEEHEDLYDVCINLAATEITISRKAKEWFQMTKTHKDVAISLMRTVEKETVTNQDVIAEIVKKNNELLNILDPTTAIQKMDHGDGDNNNIPSKKITRDQLKEKLSSANLEQFFWNLAMAEGMAEII